MQQQLVRFEDVQIGDWFKLPKGYGSRYKKTGSMEFRNSISIYFVKSVDKQVVPIARPRSDIGPQTVTSGSASAAKK